MKRAIRERIDWYTLIHSIKKAENLSLRQMCISLDVDDSYLHTLMKNDLDPRFNNGLALINWYVDVCGNQIPLLNGKKMEV